MKSNPANPKMSKTNSGANEVQATALVGDCQCPADRDPRRPAEWRKGMRSGRTMADMVNTPDYLEEARKTIAFVVLAKKNKRRIKAQQQYWERTRNITVKDMLVKAFKVPTLLALPAPGQIMRKFEDPWRFPPHDFDRRVNQANRHFVGYRPQWVIDAEKTVRVSGVDFEMLRKTCLYMTREQCAAYLRVMPDQVARWEEGTEQIPYAAYQCLRLTFETQIFKRWLPQWEGWRIIEAGQDAGKLFDPYYQKCYSAYEISQIANQWKTISKLSQECEFLRAGLAKAQAENIKLRQLFLADGVTGELREMQERIASLMTSIATAEVVDFPSTESEARLRRKTA